MNKKEEEGKKKRLGDIFQIKIKFENSKRIENHAKCYKYPTTINLQLTHFLYRNVLIM